MGPVAAAGSAVVFPPPVETAAGCWTGWGVGSAGYRSWCRRWIGSRRRWHFRNRRIGNRWRDGIRRRGLGRRLRTAGLHWCDGFWFPSDRFGASSRRWYAASFGGLDGNQRLPDRYRVTICDVNSRNLSSMGTGNLDRRLVRFNFHDVLVFLNGIAFCYQDIQNISRLDTFPKIGKLDFNTHSIIPIRLCQSRRLFPLRFNGSSPLRQSCRHRSLRIKRVDLVGIDPE